ncbi:MAG: hypothetical protein JO249_05895 [Acidobacteria bacterium]|nr:hypothetical protein [Acidobacteriota bacterium]
MTLRSSQVREPVTLMLTSLTPAIEDPARQNLVELNFHSPGHEWSPRKTSGA